MRTAWDSDSRFGLACDAMVRGADSQAMCGKRCTNHWGVTERSVDELRQLVGCPRPEEANALLSHRYDS